MKRQLAGLVAVLVGLGCGQGSAGGPGVQSPDPPPPPPPPPIPTGPAFLVADFSSFETDEELHAVAGTTTPDNVHAEPGVGMRYDFQPRPTRCGDQTLASIVSLPDDTRHVWIRFRGRFSTNWTVENPNCGSPSPDYKWVLAWLERSPPEGGKRFDLKPGTDGGRWSIFGPGWPSVQRAPAAAIQPGRAGPNPFPMDRLWDGGWHRIAIHWALLPGDRYLTQVMVDGVLIGSVETGMKRPMGLDANSLDFINIGANRNLGATELMHVWWDDLMVWTDVTGRPAASDFPSFPPPDKY